MMVDRIKKRWTRFWMKFSGPGRGGRIACGLAGLFHPPFYGRIPLAAMGKTGYFSPSAAISHSNIVWGKKVFVGEQVLIYQDHAGGAVEVGSDVHLHRGVLIQTGENGTVTIGDKTHIQPYSRISAYRGSVKIGCGVEIAPNCSFYPYNHAMEPGVPINEQPLLTQGGITIGDHAWLGVGVIVLDGVNIGEGAVVGAGSVVTEDVPPGGVAVGVPARVVKHRRLQQ